jgi:arylsulfatase A-like enzyme
MALMKISRIAWLVGLVFATAPAFGQAPADPSAPVPTAAKPRTNVIFVLVDDMGYGELGCFGNTSVKTPNLDRLAAEGIKFEQFYVNSPICSPSRVAFATGQHPARWQITSYIDNRAANKKRGMAQWLDPKAPSLARLLQSAGYRTAHVGKWHMGGGRDVGEAPLISEYGFDVSLTQFEGLGDRILPTFDTLYPNQEHRAHPLANASAKLGHGNVEYVKRHEVTGRYVDHAIAVIRAAQKQDLPFYLNVWPDDVHTPLEPSPDARGDGQIMSMYAGVLGELDRGLGKLFDIVRDDPKLRQNTLIVFASDNGHDPAIKPPANLRGHKATLYEGGVRTPMIVWWPGGQESGRIGTANASTIVAGYDLPPTVLDIANVPVPTTVQFDGQSMTDAFRGGDRKRSGAIHWMRPPDRPGPEGSFPDLAIRQGQWKFLMEENGTDEQLYDVDADPVEANNVAKENPAIVNDLKAQLIAWRKQMPQTSIDQR